MKPVVFSPADLETLKLIEQTCPNCQQVLWSRRNATFICARCYTETRRHVLLNPTGEELPFDTDFITWTDEELAQLDLIPVTVYPITNLTSNK